MPTDLTFSRAANGLRGTMKMARILANWSLTKTAN